MLKNGGENSSRAALIIPPGLATVRIPTSLAARFNCINRDTDLHLTIFQHTNNFPRYRPHFRGRVLPILVSFLIYIPIHDRRVGWFIYFKDEKISNILFEGV